MTRYRGKRGRSVPGRITAYLLVAAVSAVILFPMVVIASNAFKTESEIFTYPMTLIPRDPILKNFTRLYEGTVNFPLYIFNSFKVTILTVGIQLITATTGAYAFAKLRWKPRDVIFILYLITIMIPLQVFIIPQFVVIRTLGLYDSHAALILVSSFTAFGTFLVKQYFMTIPDSFLEAARIDGAGEGYIFVRIMLPLSGPVLATQTILSFRFFWNDFFTPLIYLTSPGRKTLPLGMADFATEYFTYYGPQMAASLIAILPVLVVFFVGQKYIVQGTVTTGVKG